MKGWLLDTNVLSELRKPKCDRKVRDWVRLREPEELFVSRITFAEIWFGIERLAHAEKRALLHAWLDIEFRGWFDKRVLEVDEDVIVRWREWVEMGRRIGRTFSQPDLFLAATADVHRLVFITRNISDFADLPIPVENPWER